MIKDFSQFTDISYTIDKIQEPIYISGSYFSSSISSFSHNNFYTKNYVDICSGSSLSGGFYCTIFDGAPTDFSSSGLVDLLFGTSVSSSLLSRTETILKNEKQKIYEAMAEKLLGNKSNLFKLGSTNYNEVFFLSLKKRIYKDEIQKGTFNLNIQISGTTSVNISLLDKVESLYQFVDKNSGDYCALYNGSTQVGALYYNTGIAWFHSGVFLPTGATKSVYWSGSTTNKMDLNQITISGNLDQILDGFKNRINYVKFNNSLNMYKSIYFCRATKDEFNYSTNPTFVDGKAIKNIITVKTDTSNNKVLETSKTYITKVGLYDINGNLLAICCLPQPVKKDVSIELTIRAVLNW